MKSNYYNTHTNINFQNIKNSLSHPRISTYEEESKDTEHAFQLYCWNLQISSALLECISVCEVVIRNAAADSVKKVYGADWFKNKAFLISLPEISRNQLKNITNKKNYSSIDELIPDLPFSFWQSLFTKRFYNKLWQDQLCTILPNVSHEEFREDLRKDLDRIRKLRNRIAHHEPIFNHNLLAEYEVIIKIIGYRCQDTKNWVQSWQKVERLLKIKP